MATQLDIRIEGESLDLQPGEDQRFYVTRQIYDLTNLETRNASSAKSLTIPKSRRNLSIIGNALPTKGRFDSKEWEAINCDVLIAGIPIINDAYFFIGLEEESTLTISLVGGTAAFFRSLSDNLISTLNFSQYDLDWTLPGVDAIKATTTGATIANSLWYSNQSRRVYEAFGGLDVQTDLQALQLGEMGLFFYAKTILDTIFAASNQFSFVYDFDTAEFIKYALPLSVPNIHESFTRIDGVLLEVQSTNYNVGLDSNFNKIPFPTEVNVPVSDILEWDPLLNRYVFLKAAFIEIEFICSGNSRNEDGYRYELWQNVADGQQPNPINGDIGLGATQVITSGASLTDYDVSLKTSIYGEIGDFVEIFSKGGSGGDTRFITDGRFIMQQSGAGRGTEVLISSILPEISQRQFVKEIFKYFNMYAVQSGFVVTLKLFQNINKNDAIQLDLDRSRPFEVATSLATYAQTNYVKYAPNTAIERLDADGSFPVNSQTLIKDGDKITLVWAAMDLAEAPSTGNPVRGCIPQYEIDWNFIDDNKLQINNGTNVYTTTQRNDIEPGDFISYDDGGIFRIRRVVTVNTDFSGLVDIPAPAQASDKDWNHWRYNANDTFMQIARLETSPVNYQVADGGNTPLSVVGGWSSLFQGPELWDNRLDVYYERLTSAVLKPFVVIAWARVPVIQFSAIEEDHPIYIEEFDAYFYLNKLEQWKRDGLCRLELIQLIL